MRNISPLAKFCPSLCLKVIKQGKIGSLYVTTANRYISVTERNLGDEGVLCKQAVTVEQLARRRQSSHSRVETAKTEIRDSGCQRRELQQRMKDFSPKQQQPWRQGKLMKLVGDCVDEMSSVTVTDSPSFTEIIRKTPTEATRKIC